MNNSSNKDLSAVLRTDIDINVAKEVFLKHLKIKLANKKLRYPQDHQLKQIESSPVIQNPIESAVGVQSTIKVNLLKKLMRPPVKIAFLLLRPFLRPIAYRTRNFLLNTFRYELQSIISENNKNLSDLLCQRSNCVEAKLEQSLLKHQFTQDNLMEMQTIIQKNTMMLTQLLQTNHSIVLDEIHWISDGLIKNIENFKASLETSINDLHIKINDKCSSLQSDLNKINDTYQVLTCETQSKISTTAKTMIEAVHNSSENLKSKIIDLDGRLISANQIFEDKAGALLSGIDEKFNIKFNSFDDKLITNLKEHDSKLNRIETYALANAKRFAINCSNNITLVRTEVGYLSCSSSDYQLLSFLIDSGEMERGTCQLIKKILKPGNIFIDVGANIGMHTLTAARALQSNGSIYAFEPFPNTCEHLKRTIEINGLISIVNIHQIALYNSNGIHQFFVGKTCGHNSLFSLDEDNSDNPSTVSVPVAKLDDLLPKNISADLMKIDVEGAEIEVIEGAIELIHRSPNISLIVEYAPNHIRRRNKTTFDWIASFVNLGFKYQVIDPITGSLSDYSLTELEKFDSINLLFTRSNISF